MNLSKPTRWGIVSAGLVSSDFARALKGATDEKHTVHAVAARDLNRAKEFADRIGIPRAYGSYQELANDPDIDVVYVGSVPASHYDIITMMLNADKAVLSEKPACVTYQQACDIVALAQRRRVLFMEGMWSRFFPAYGKLRETLDQGTIGEAQIVNFTMGFDYVKTDWDYKVNWHMDPKAGGGIGLAFGVYAISLGDWVFRDTPTKVTATGDIAPTGCDTTCTFVLEYPRNRRLVCTVSSVCNMYNNAVICCQKGVVQLPQPWCPVRIKIKDEWFDYPAPKSDVKFHYFNCTGFLYEADHVRELLQKGLVESPISSFECTKNTMKIADEVRRKMGVVFSEDS